MLEIVCKILFFLSMLIVYANVTSTGSVIVIVLGYIACVFSYYYFNNIQGAIDEWFNYFNVNTRFNDTMNSQVSGYFVSRKYNKINNGSVASVGDPKKIFPPLSNSDSTFSKENNLLENYGSSIMKPEFKSNGDLPSPIMKNVSPSKSNRSNREKLKIYFDPKVDVPSRKDMIHVYNILGPTRRYNASLDLETYMNVNSPGFTSRVVDKAAESASYHMKYPAVRQIPAYRFDKSTIRHLSKMPKANSTPAVRIAPPDTSLDILNNENVNNETNSDNVKSSNFLQVLRDISRKRNYSQEETDRTGSTPKKSRKSDVKNILSSQYKRAHEDCSNDSIEDKSRKKRCDDNDRNYAKMMSFTSSMSVLAPEFSWNNSKKRKSSKLEKSKNESFEKLEKFRKISEDLIKDVPTEETTSKTENNATYKIKTKEPEVQVEKDSQNEIKKMDETDNKFVDVFPNDEDGEYVRVASGKILNRISCTYRKKLNNSKINPVSVIATEPEFVSETSYIDDKTVKENLLKNLTDNVERKGEKKENVIFYQNSIIEEIEKNVSQVEVHQSDTVVHTSALFNPLLSPVSRPSTNNVQFGMPVVHVTVSEAKPNYSSSLFANTYKSNSSSDIKTSDSYAFGISVDTVDSKSPTTVSVETKNSDFSASKASFNISQPNTSSTNKSTSVIISPSKTTEFAVSSVLNSVTTSFETITTDVVSPHVIQTTSSSGPFTSTVSTSSPLSSSPALSDLTKSNQPVNTFQFGQNTTLIETNTSSTLFNVASSSASEGEFKFGATPSAVSTTPFGTTIVAQSTFNTSTPSFNFSGNSMFGTGNVPFGGVNASEPTNNSFNFDSNNMQPAQQAHPSFSGVNGSQPTNNSFSFCSSNAQPPQQTQSSQASYNVQPAQQTQPSFGDVNASQPTSNAFSFAPNSVQPPQQTQPSQTSFQFGGMSSQPFMFGADAVSAANTGASALSNLTNSSSQINTFQFGQNIPNTSSTLFNVASSDANDGGFKFGATPAATSAVTPFGVTTVAPVAQSTFNTSTPSFNFSNNAIFSTGNTTFGDGNASQPTSNSLFGFGSNNIQPTQQTQLPQPPFQFGTNASVMPSQPFMFGAGAAPAANTGAFNIGTGGGSTRSRATARPRKAK